MGEKGRPDQTAFIGRDGDALAAETVAKGVGRCGACVLCLGLEKEDSRSHGLVRSDWLPGGRLREFGNAVGVGNLPVEFLKPSVR